MKKKFFFSEIIFVIFNHSQRGLFQICDIKFYTEQKKIMRDKALVTKKY